MPKIARCSGEQPRFLMAAFPFLFMPLGQARLGKHTFAQTVPKTHALCYNQMRNFDDAKQEH